MRKEVDRRRGGRLVIGGMRDCPQYKGEIGEISLNWRGLGSVAGRMDTEAMMLFAYVLLTLYFFFVYLRLYHLAGVAQR